MKKLYSVVSLIGIIFSGFAQTQPAPQSIPYEQRFDSLLTGVTRYPEGWKGWSMGGSLASTAFKTIGPVSDKNLLSGSASSTAGAIYNYKEKLGFLNSGTSGDQGLVLAVNLSGKQNISVSFDAMTIRNPYGGTNNRINELALQYRIDTTGTFSNVAGTEYRNNTTNQQSGTDPQNLMSFSVILPAEVNNKSVVQLRWISREVQGAGSRPSFAIDDVKVFGSGADNQPPVISSVNPANNAIEVAPSVLPSLRFSESVIAGTGKFILHNLTKGTQQSFEISSSPITISGTLVTINTKLKPLTQYYIEIEPGTLKDAAGNTFEGLIGRSSWTFSTGPQQLVFDFSNCPTGSTAEFIQHNITGVQKWECTTFGESGSGIQINGFSGSAIENEDWLISPSFDLSSFDFPLLSFSTRSRFAGPSLELMVSQDYDGIGDPKNFTWVPLKGRFPTVDSDVWVKTADVNLSDYKSENIHIAFVYHSGPSSGASRWTLDSFAIANSPTPPNPGVTINREELDFDYVPSGSTSTIDSITLMAYNLRGNLNLNAPEGFLISTDKSDFSSSVTIPVEIAESYNKLYIRFSPAIADMDYSSSLSFISDALNKNIVTLSGTSLRALKVVNWNIEWFGSLENGPTNENVQEENVLTVLKKINADVYALEEVVDTMRLKQVVDKMPGYAYSVSDYGSYTEDVNDPDYASAQKLAFVYRKSAVSSIQIYGMFRFGGSENAYYHWSSGRFPYVMKAKVHLHNDTSEVQFVLLHAKANTGTRSEKIEAWHRRKLAADELKDSLDVHYPFSNIIILGDFNDDLDKTITTEMLPDTTTSYISFVSDTNDYKLLTLPLSQADQRSTASFSSVIDHQVASNEMGIAYVPGSAKIITSVSSLIKSYATTTSDHYPVLGRYDLRFLSPLVKLSDFDATVEESNVILNWVTSHQINAAKFIIERSRNNKDFIAVDSIAANRDERNHSHYQVTDKKPWPGKSHYRLKYTLLDGSFYYSDIETIIMKSNSHFLVSKPSDNVTATVRYTTIEAENGTLQLIDINGRVYLQKSAIFVKGQNQNYINTAGLPVGVYVIRLVLKDRVESAKIIIAN